MQAVKFLFACLLVLSSLVDGRPIDNPNTLVTHSNPNPRAVQIFEPTHHHSRQRPFIPVSNEGSRPSSFQKRLKAPTAHKIRPILHHAQRLVSPTLATSSASSPKVARSSQTSHQSYRHNYQMAMLGDARIHSLRDTKTAKIDLLVGTELHDTHSTDLSNRRELTTSREIECGPCEPVLALEPLSDATFMAFGDGYPVVDSVEEAPLEAVPSLAFSLENENWSAPKASAEVQTEAIEMVRRNRKEALIDRELSSRPANNMNPKKSEPIATVAEPASARPAPQGTVSSATFEVYISPIEHELQSILSASATLNSHFTGHKHHKRVDTKDEAMDSSFLLLKNGQLVPMSDEILSILSALAAQSYGETTVLNAIDAHASPTITGSNNTLAISGENGGSESVSIHDTSLPVAQEETIGQSTTPVLFETPSLVSDPSFGYGASPQADGDVESTTPKVSVAQNETFDPTREEEENPPIITEAPPAAKKAALLAHDDELQELQPPNVQHDDEEQIHTDDGSPQEQGTHSIAVPISSEVHSALPTASPAKEHTGTDITSSNKALTVLSVIMIVLFTLILICAAIAAVLKDRIIKDERANDDIRQTQPRFYDEQMSAPSKMCSTRSDKSSLCALNGCPSCASSRM